MKYNAISIVILSTLDDIERPGFFDQKGRAKWDAWDSKKGTYNKALCNLVLNS